jgi:membrane protein implicated in regulation of membrane protease activity
MMSAILAATQDRAEGWTWWLMMVLMVTLVMLLVVAVRRRLVKPMPHTPSDTTDAWSEAGRRMAVPPAEGERPDAADDEETR